MIRPKEKFQMRRKVGPYTISLINLINSHIYLINKEWAELYLAFNIGSIYKGLKAVSGWWEIMVDDPEEGWGDKHRFKYKHRAVKAYKELIKKYESMCNNRKEEQSEASEQE